MGDGQNILSALSECSEAFQLSSSQYPDRFPGNAHATRRDIFSVPHFSEPEVVKLLEGWNVDRPNLVGEGMEGAVYSLGRNEVAKVWFSNPSIAVRSMKVFYDALREKPLRFAVPQIVDVREVDGRTISVERRLDGIAVAGAVEAGRVTRAQAQGMVVGVLAELANSGPCSEARLLTVMDEADPFWPQDGEFRDGLKLLIRQRASRFGKVLAGAVDDFERKVEALLARIDEADSGSRTVIHGDLVLPNLLIGDDSSVGAVLDWGFFSTEGDPIFEAAVAASIFEMYGNDALESEMAMYEQIEDSLGYDRAALLVYRAAYSLMTANAYDPAGNDGHFAWCAAGLNRPDVVAAIRA